MEFLTICVLLTLLPSCSIFGTNKPQNGWKPTFVLLPKIIWNSPSDIWALRNLFPASVSATQKYRVTCPVNTTSLSSRIGKINPLSSAFFTIYLSKPSFSDSTKKTDKKADLNFSDWTKLPGGSGDYLMIIEKTASNHLGIEYYYAHLSCNDANNRELKNNGIVKVS